MSKLIEINDCFSCPDFRDELTYKKKYYDEGFCDKYKLDLCRIDWLNEIHPKCKLPEAKCI